MFHNSNRECGLGVAGDSMDENASPEPFLGRNRKLRTHIQVVTSPRTPKQGKAGIKSAAYFFTSYRDIRWLIVFYRKAPRNPPDILYGMEPLLPQGQFRKCLRSHPNVLFKNLASNYSTLFPLRTTNSSPCVFYGVSSFRSPQPF